MSNISEQAVEAAWPTHCIHGRSVNGPEWCPDCKRMGLDPEVTDVAWKILQALHENVAEAERPMSWSDVNGDQEQRIRAAAVAAIETIRARDALALPHTGQPQERCDDTPWEVRVKDRGLGHFGSYGIADRHGTLILEDITLELARRIVNSVNAAVLASLRAEGEWQPIEARPLATGKYLVGHRGHQEVITFLSPNDNVWLPNAKLGWQRDPLAFKATHCLFLEPLIDVLPAPAIVAEKRKP